MESETGTGNWPAIDSPDDLLKYGIKLNYIPLKYNIECLTTKSDFELCFSHLNCLLKLCFFVKLWRLFN